MNDLDKAIEILKNGGIVIYPTDTVFGIACRIDNDDAIKRLFAIKQRNMKHAVPVLVASIAMAEEYLLPIPDEVKEKLMERYWPGGLTIVLPCDTKKVSPLVRGLGDTLAVRMPNHSLTLQIINGVGVPIVGTSANFHGGKTPATQEALDPELVKLVDFVLPGECFKGMSSTIIDCSVTPWKILREGAIPTSSLRESVNDEAIS